MQRSCKPLYHGVFQEACWVRKGGNIWPASKSSLLREGLVSFISISLYILSDI